MACRIPYILRLLPIILWAAAPAAAEPIAVEARPIAIDASAEGEQRVGSLVYRGGLELTSAYRHFGGLSALAVTPDGRRLTTLSDRGHRFVLALRYDDRGRLIGVDDADGERLRGLDGKPLRGKKNSDAESLARAGPDATIVAFEQRHRLWRYPSDGGAPTALPLPPGAADLSRNSGLEAMASLGQGRLLVIAEGAGGADDHPAWIGGQSGWQRLTFVPASGFKPTAAARHPDGDVLVVERAVNLLGFFSAHLVRIDASHIKAGNRLQGRVVAVFREPLTVDNFEGIAVRPGPRGNPLIYLISDDNFRGAQRTLLMMFELESER
jgi:YD repeat-containing protein